MVLDGAVFPRLSSMTLDRDETAVEYEGYTTVGPESLRDTISKLRMLPRCRIIRVRKGLRRWSWKDGFDGWDMLVESQVGELDMLLKAKAREDRERREKAGRETGVEEEEEGDDFVPEKEAGVIYFGARR